jgi:hypothetical protein
MTLIATGNPGLTLSAIAVGAFCVFLITAPPFWLAIVLIVLIPFEGLTTALLGGFDSSARQWAAMWKEVLLAIGIFRVLRGNLNCRAIMSTNRWVLIWSGLLMVVYLVTFVRLPSIPAIFALDLETRFLGVMILFMFLDINDKGITTLLRTIVWSVSLIALYGIFQYVWDYERLLPLMYHVADLSADGTRRLYSYALSVFDCGYGALIAILILFTGAARMTTRSSLLCLTLLLPCLLLTFVRSAYIGLLCGTIVLVVMNRTHLRRYLLMGGVVVYALLLSFLIAGASLLDSSVGRRVESIVSQTDGSSAAHKESMKTAVKLITANPLGIGLGKSGIVQARFAGDVDKADFTEDWVLQAAVQTGVFGAFAYLGLTGAILVSLLLSRIPRNGESRRLRALAAGVFVAMTIAGVMIPVWDHLLTAVYAWALVGLALGRGPRITSRSNASVSN